MSLQAHHEVHGEMRLTSGRRKRREPMSLIDEVEMAGLLGRGGAAFPTAVKLRTVAAARHRAIVIVNGAEGEPASLKDQLLMETLPHLVLDGGSLAAMATGAGALIVCLSQSAKAARHSLTRAMEERVRARSDAVPIKLELVSDRYLAGQESALVNHLNGGPGIPTSTPPMPFERGVRRRPTLINNVETLAQIALIARHGAAWFRELGGPDQPGSTLLTLSGAVEYPGVYEIECGVPLARVLAAAGGTTSKVRALLLGGYSGTWLDGRLADTLILSSEHLSSHHAGLGPGIVLALSEHSCGVAETLRVAQWLAGQTAGQCGPCVHGLKAITGAIDELATGTATSDTQRHVARWASMVRGRGACAHPDGAVNFVSSALSVFAEEFAEHARYGPCQACSRHSELPLSAHPPLAVVV